MSTEDHLAEVLSKYSLVFRLHILLLADENLVFSPITSVLLECIHIEDLRGG